MLSRLLGARWQVERLARQASTAGCKRVEDTAPDFFHMAEGRCVNVGGAYVYEYMLRDHLGSVRAAFDVVNDSARIVDANHYYPFGLHIDSLRYHISPGADENEYAYNGKEWQNEGGFNQYDYGARMYDPAVGRWWVVDPLADQMRRHSPYNYAFNNPMRWIDPDGMKAKAVPWAPEVTPDGMAPNDDYYDYAGRYLGSDGVGNKARLIKRDTWNAVIESGGSVVSNLKSQSRILKLPTDAEYQAKRSEIVSKTNETSVEHYAGVFLDQEKAEVYIGEVHQGIDQVSAYAQAPGVVQIGDHIEEMVLENIDVRNTDGILSSSWNNTANDEFVTVQIGQMHGHSEASGKRGVSVEQNSSGGSDMKAAVNTGMVIIAHDSKYTHIASPHGFAHEKISKDQNPIRRSLIERK